MIKRDIMILVIILSLGLLSLVVGVAYCFALQEQKTIKSKPAELDEQTRQARREAATSITNFPPS